MQLKIHVATDNTAIFAATSPLASPTDFIRRFDPVNGAFKVSKFLTVLSTL
jgi:hypothetical protein